MQCKLVVSRKKWVDINEYMYVCIKSVHACWENWQYALTMQVPLGNIFISGAQTELSQFCAVVTKKSRSILIQYYISLNIWVFTKLPDDMPKTYNSYDWPKNNYQFAQSWTSKLPCNRVFSYNNTLIFRLLLTFFLNFCFSYFGHFCPG